MGIAVIVVSFMATLCTGLRQRDVLVSLRAWLLADHRVSVLVIAVFGAVCGNVSSRRLSPPLYYRARAFSCRFNHHQLAVRGVTNPRAARGVRPDHHSPAPTRWRRASASCTRSSFMAASANGWTPCRGAQGTHGNPQRADHGGAACRWPSWPSRVMTSIVKENRYG